MSAPDAESFENAAPVVPFRSRELPASSEAEEHVLACVLLDGDGETGGDTLGRAITEGLHPESFFWPANQTLFARMMAMRRAGTPVSTITLVESLSAEEMSIVGGMPYIMQVAGRAPTTTLAAHFIQAVKEKADRRALIRDLTGSVEQAYNGVELPDLLQQAKARIEAIQSGSAVTKKKDELAALLSRRVQACSPPPEPVTRLWLADKPIATGGNLQTMTAKSKAGKTVATGAGVAAVICAATGTTPQDTFQFRASNPKGHAVIVIDTEQSPYDAWTCYQRVLKRAGTEQDPKWLLHFALVGYSVAKRKQALALALEYAKTTFGGVFLVILDGVAHFVASVNDIAECNTMADWLREQTVTYDCPILCVIHSNEGDKSGDDSRGHLGKQLMRDAESNLLLKKSGDVTTITSDKQRKAPITEKDGVAFQWSDEQQMHVSCGSVSDGKLEAKRDRMHEMAEAVFEHLGKQFARYAELVKAIAEVRKVGASRAEDRFSEMKKLGVITKDIVGNWSITP